MLENKHYVLWLHSHVLRVLFRAGRWQSACPSFEQKFQDGIDRLYSASPGHEQDDHGASGVSDPQAHEPVPRVPPVITTIGFQLGVLPTSKLSVAHLHFHLLLNVVPSAGSSADFVLTEYKSTMATDERVADALLAPSSTFSHVPAAAATSPRACPRSETTS